MATYTENYSLVKPGYGDQADIDVLNRLMTDKVDALLFENRKISGDEYDQTETYAVGDYAIYENVLYKCLEDTTGNFDPSKWEMTNLAKEISTKGGADVTKTASGNPITFDDGADAPLVKCDVTISPKQDLHGYDKPWVGGAGKNKCDLVSNYSVTTDGITVETTTDGEIWVHGTPTISSGYISFAEVGTVLTTVDGQTVTFSVNEKNSGVGFISGSNNGALNLTLSDTTRYKTGPYSSGGSHAITVNVRFDVGTIDKKYKLQIELGSTLTDWTPYSNICPITAYTEGEIVVRGGNLLDETIAHTNDRYWAVGTPSTSSSEIDGTLTLSAGTYTFSVDKVCQIVSVSCEDSQYIVQYNVNKVTFTITYKQGVRIALVCATSSDLPTTHMLNTGSSAKNYEEYRGTTHTTTYPSAIYRGSEDVVNGEVTITKKCVYFSDLTWTLYGPNLFYVDLVDKKNAESAIITDDILCSNYEPSPGNDVVSLGKDFSVGSSVSNGRVFVRDSRCSTVTEFNAVNTTSQLVYVLTTPTTSSVTPTNLPIKSLSPYTHIESSTGDMEVEYITEEYQPLVDLIESNKHVYSTAEQIVGTWIDGSVVYEKTYDIGYLTSNNKTIAHGISGFGHIIQIHGYVTNDTYDFNLPHVTTDAASCVGVHVDITNIYITSYDRSDYHGYVIIQYTKTTPTRSLNLTKSAVNEIPDEIKNAEYEEKPDVNEADDDAPTEVDER